MRGRPRPIVWIAAAFLGLQVWLIAFAANGPFVDEGLYTVAGLRVLEGHGRSDGYLAWFNGSPFVWPVLAGLGHHVAGLAGARLMAALLSTVTLLAFARTAEHLFGRSAAVWSAVAFGVNGLFLALAHFAVYDVAALTALAVAMWCATRPRASAGWTIAAGVAFAAAVVAKYGYVPMLVPLVGLLVAARGRGGAGRAVGVFVAVVGVIVAAYFWLCFGSLMPSSSSSYLTQTFGRTRGHIAVLQVIFGLVPVALAGAGAVVAWRRGQRLLVAACLLAVTVFPLFHLWTANFVSGQKHVVAGFLFAYLLAGLAFERLWSRSPAAAVVLLVVVATWGGVQCFWQDRSWSDTRALARHLALGMKRGEEIVAESSWSYTLYLYPAGVVRSPADVIDANHTPGLGQRDLCRIPWLVGDPSTAEPIRRALAQCPHQRVLSSATAHYYFDTTRLRLATYPVVVSVWHATRSK